MLNNKICLLLLQCQQRLLRCCLYNSKTIFKVTSVILQQTVHSAPIHAFLEFIPKALCMIMFRSNHCLSHTTIVNTLTNKETLLLLKLRIICKWLTLYNIIPSLNDPKEDALEYIVEKNSFVVCK